MGYGFCLGFRSPTRTPTPAKPAPKPAGFTNPCYSLSTATWKQAFLDEKTDEYEGYDFGPYEDFIHEMKTHFMDVDSQAVGSYKLREMRQGPNTVEQHNAEFRVTLADSGLDKKQFDRLLVEYYQASLNEKILLAVWRQKPQPVGLHNWMKAAQEEDSKYRQFQRFRGSFAKKEQGYPF